MKKIKIKVKLVNTKMLQGPTCLKVPTSRKKMCTIVKAFDITEVPKRTAAIPKKPIEFHARPVPNDIF